MAKILISFTDEEQEQYALCRGVLQDYYKTIEVKETKNTLFILFRQLNYESLALCIKHWGSHW